MQQNDMKYTKVQLYMKYIKDNLTLLSTVCQN